jgi:hypothetical protein
MALGGGLIGAYGSIAAGNEAKAAGEFNARIEEDNAEFAKVAGEERAKQIIRAGDESRSTTRARASASGLVADTGSPLLVQEEAVYQAALGANKARYTASVEAYGHRNRGRLYRMSGRQAQSAGYVRAGASMLQAGAYAYANYGKGFE